MKRTLVIGLVMLLTLFAGMIIVAQDEAPLPLGECNEESQAWLADRMGEITDAIVEAADQQEIDMILFQTQTVMETYRSRCNGLIFTSADYGMSVATDVIIFPDGIYRMIFESDGNATVDVTEADGECGDGYTYTSADNPRVESVANMEGCIAILEINGGSNATTWTLTYEPILLSEDE